MKSTQKFDSFSNVQFEKFIFVKILTSEDEHCRSATCNTIQKPCLQFIGVFSKPFS